MEIYRETKNYLSLTNTKLYFKIIIIKLKKNMITSKKKRSYWETLISTFSINLLIITNPGRKSKLLSNCNRQKCIG